MFNYYDGMESDDYEDYEITWEDADDIEFKKKSKIQKYIHIQYEHNCGLILRQSLFDLCTTGWLPPASAFLSEPTEAVALPGRPQGSRRHPLRIIYTASP